MTDFALARRNMVEGQLPDALRTVGDAVEQGDLIGVLLLLFEADVAVHGDEAAQLLLRHLLVTLLLATIFLSILALGP